MKCRHRIHSTISRPDANQATLRLHHELPGSARHDRGGDERSGGVTAAQVAAMARPAWRSPQRYNASSQPWGRSTGCATTAADYFGPETMTVITNDRGTPAVARDADLIRNHHGECETMASFTKGPNEKLPTPPAGRSVWNWRRIFRGTGERILQGAQLHRHQ